MMDICEKHNLDYEVEEIFAAQNRKDVYKRQEQSDIFEEFDVTMSVIESLLVRERDREGKIHILSLIHI